MLLVAMLDQVKKINEGTLYFRTNKIIMRVGE